MRAKQEGHCKVAACSERQHGVRQLSCLRVEMGREALYRLLYHVECLTRLLETCRFGILTRSALGD